MADYGIVLNVNTGSIPQTITAPDTIDNYCSFTGQVNDQTPENFNINVDNGDTLTWSGVSSSNPTTDTVPITEIDYDSGNHLFGNDDLRPATGATTITGTVTGATDPEVDYEEEYIIKFTDKKNGVLWGSYEIDPKITVSASNR